MQVTFGALCLPDCVIHVASAVSIQWSLITSPHSNTILQRCYNQTVSKFPTIKVRPHHNMTAGISIHKIFSMIQIQIHVSSMMTPKCLHSLTCLILEPFIVTVTLWISSVCNLCLDPMNMKSDLSALRLSSLTPMGLEHLRYVIKDIKSITVFAESFLNNMRRLFRKRGTLKISRIWIVFILSSWPSHEQSSYLKVLG